jgi:hypothetical protein
MRPIQFLFTFLALSGCLYAQAWSGILLPTYGSTTCNPLATSSPGQCAIDWTMAGIPGGIPSGSWTQSGSTIQASTYGSGSTDATSGIQSALNSCSGNKYVLLGAGTFLIDGNLTVGGGCVLRGAGANQTVLNLMTTSGQSVVVGAPPGEPNFSNAVSISSGATAGSTSIVVSSASGISAGTLLVISNVNDGTIVTQYGSEGQCTWCDGETSDGSRVQGQIDRVTAVSGTTLTLEQPLFVTYSNTPHATPFTPVQYAGVENLQVYANNTHSGGDYSNFLINKCAYCWLSGVEGNYADGDHVEAEWSYRGEIVNSYFSNAFLHTAGSYDSDVDLMFKTTAFLVQNNILERLHVSIMLEWGVAGNVIAYNYNFGCFDGSGANLVLQDVSFHGAHPQFNLFEGNVSATLAQDTIWGSAANNTFFRDWAVGTTKIGCTPLTGRGTVSCSSGFYAYQADWAVSPGFITSNNNFVGDVVGSAAAENNTAYGNPVTKVDTTVSLCGPSPCGAGSRPYDGDVFDFTFGYGEASDDGTGGTTDGAGCDGSFGYPCHSLLSYNTTFIHGTYSNISGAITWASGVTQSLPNSFYLSSKPGWWTSSVPWPAIGPDVTGGGGPGGHTYSLTASNPAQYCYTAVMGGTDGTGSPLAFNANTCYVSAAPPAPPTGVNAVGH